MSAPTIGLDSATVADLLQQAATLQTSGQLIEAEHLYVRLLDSDPTRFELLYGFGVLRLQQNNFEDAERLFRQAIKVNNKSAEAHQYIGFALTGLKQTETAIQAYKKALAIRPSFPEAHNNLGHALQVLGRL